MLIATIQVLVGAFVMFTIARLAHDRLTERSGWLWVALAALLAVTSMLVHRFLLGSTISPPFYTALLFAITLAGLRPKNSGLAKWRKRAIYGVVLGTVVGWASYAEVGALAVFSFAEPPLAAR